MASGELQRTATIHVDLDGARQIFRHHGWPYPWKDDLLFESGLRNLLGFFGEHEIRATLFVIAEDLADPRKRELIHAAVTEGHSIASHSLNHPEFDDLTAAEKRSEVIESKTRLEDELGVAVRGFRTPSYQIDRETLELLVETGYEWDSSVFPEPAFARRLEVPAIPPVPFRPLLGKPLTEIPLPGYRPLPFPFNPSYSLLLGRFYFDWNLSRFARSGHPLVLLFHLTDFAEPLSGERLPNFKSRLFTLSARAADAKRSRCHAMLDCVRSRYEIVSTEELIDRATGSRDLVLGVSTTHETGAALYQGAKCLAAISEERLDRVKFSTKFPPARSIAAVIEETGVRPERITDVVVAGLPPARLLGRLARGQWADTTEFHGWNDYFPHFNKVLYRVFAFVRSLSYRRVLRLIESSYGIRPRLHFVAHHLCHAASAYRSAPFDSALIVTADGVGDDISITVSEGQRGRIRLRCLVPYPHSLGQFYTACTQVLGFRANRHEGKITGLSGFGQVDPGLYKKVRSTIRESGPRFRLDKRYYSEGIVRGFSLNRFRRGEDLFETLQYRNYKSPLRKLLAGHSREDVAAVFQCVLEEELIALVRPFAEGSNLRNLCLAGGVFANVKANSALFRGLGFENVYIFPHMGDGGLACGAALEFLQAPPTPFNSVYWGPEYDEAEIEVALRESEGQGLHFRREDEIERAVATLLADGNVVARFAGRMEFGPRALGNRSILYGAGDPAANRWLNQRLGRTEFMPFAPIVLADQAQNLFKGIEGTEHACRFMTIILECTDWTKENCPAVVHVDGTARPQFVHADTNPSIHRVLEHYRDLTGIPLLVNTSFNMHEEPIVCSPRDAIRAFIASRLDWLAIGPFLARLPDGATAEPGHRLAPGTPNGG